MHSSLYLGQLGLSEGKGGLHRVPPKVLNQLEHISTHLHLSRQNPSTPHATIGEMLAPFSMANLRLPLQAAMTLSPICLLANMALTLHTVAEDKLCQVTGYSHYDASPKLSLLQIWRCFGGSRPPVLQDVELQVWNIIWDHATETIDLRARLQNTLSNIVQEISRSLERKAVSWFSESEYRGRN